MSGWCSGNPPSLKGGYEVEDVGYRAESIVSTALGGISVVEPVKEGAIADEDMFVQMLKLFLKRILPASAIPPRVSAVVAISCSMTGGDRRVVEFSKPASKRSLSSNRRSVSSRTRAA